MKIYGTGNNPLVIETDFTSKNTALKSKLKDVAFTGIKSIKIEMFPVGIPTATIEMYIEKEKLENDA